MNEALLQQARMVYLLALETHIKLLTKCYTRHKGTEGTYEDLFAIFHELSEKNEQITPSEGEANELVTSLYMEVERLKKSLKESISKEKDEGVKNQLISKYDGIQMTCAKLLSLIDEEDAEEDAYEEKKSNVLKKS